MLRINLLPPYIHQRKQVRLAITLVVIAVAAEVGVLVMMRNGPLAQQAKMNAELAEKNGRKSQLDALGSQANAVLAEETALAPKYDFMTGMLKYNREYPGLYQDTARYTYSEAMALSMEASPNQLTLHAYVTNPTDASRLLLGLSRSPRFEALPQLSGVPGFDAQQEQQRQAQEEGLPGTSIIGGMAGAEGAIAPGGMMAGGGNGPGGGMMGGESAIGGAPTGPGPGAMMTMGGGNGPGGGGMMMGGAMGGMGGGMGGGSNGGGSLQAIQTLAAARQKPRGFNVTVTCALKQPITRPSYGTSDSQAGGGGGGGGMGGMGGGMWMGGLGGGNGPGGMTMGGGSMNGPR